MVPALGGSSAKQESTPRLYHKKGKGATGWQVERINAR